MYGKKTHYHDAKGRTAHITRLRGGYVWTLAIRGTDGHLNEVSRHRSEDAAIKALRAAGDWYDLPDED